jgi:hypothetical protein
VPASSLSLPYGILCTPTPLASVRSEGTLGAPRVFVPGMSRVLRINPPAGESATRLVLGLGLSVILAVEHPRG